MEYHGSTGITRARRKSAFRETGLFEDEGQDLPPSPVQSSRPALKVRFRSKNDIFEHTQDDDEWEDVDESDADWDWLPSPARTVAPPAAPKRLAFLVHRLTLIAFVLAIVIPITQLTTFGSPNHPMLGATGVPVPERPEPVFEETLTRRDGSVTDYCKRWSQQSAYLILGFGLKDPG